MGRARIIALLVALALVAGNLVAFNVLLSGWSTARVDLTDEGIYSISPATRRLLTSLEEDVTIIGYFSRRTHPKLAPLVPQLEDLLEEYRAVAGGRVAIEIVDPGQDEEAEREAAERYGVQSAPFKLATKFESSIVNAYFSVVVKYADQYVRYGFSDLIEIRPAPDGDLDVALRNPEYDLTRAIKKVVFGFRTTNELFERVEGTVRLSAIWSPDALPEMFAEVPQAVRAAAEALEQAGGDAFEFEELDPTGDEALQQQLRDAYDTRPLSLGLFGDASTFYLDAILDVGGRLERLPLLDEGVSTASVREAVEDSLRRNTPGFLKTVGIVTPDEDQLPPEMRMQFNLPPQSPPRFAEIERFLEQDYSIARVDLDDAAGVPTAVDVLLVLEPRELSAGALYRLDQYLMRGGRVILCAGRYDASFDAEGLRVEPIETGLDDWLAHHGVTIGGTLVLDDRNQALPIPEIRRTPFGSFRSWRLEPYPYLVQVRDEGLLNREIAASLGAVGIYWGSPLRVDESALGELEVLPILQSSARSWTDDDTVAAGRVAEYTVPDGSEPQLLALALAGRFESYWAEREPPMPETEPTDGTTPEQPAAPPPVPIAASPDTRLIVIANSAFVSDFVARALAQVDGGFFVENLRFVQNAIDWSSLDNELLEIRSRGTAQRRLRRTEPETQAALEVAGYTVPVALLALLAGGLRWRRNRQAPLDGGAGPEA